MNITITKQQLIIRKDKSNISILKAEMLLYGILYIAIFIAMMIKSESEFYIKIIIGLILSFVFIIVTKRIFKKVNEKDIVIDRISNSKFAIQEIAIELNQIRYLKVNALTNTNNFKITYDLFIAMNNKKRILLCYGATENEKDQILYNLNSFFNDNIEVCEKRIFW